MPSAAGFPTAEFPTTSEAVVAASRIDERNECVHCNLTTWGHFADAPWDLGMLLPQSS